MPELHQTQMASPAEGQHDAPFDQETHRQDALRELLETERTYVARLTTTYKVYIVGTATLLSDVERNSLFSNLEEILIANDSFLQDLERRFQSDGETVSGIGDIFLNHVQQFGLYLVYCRNQQSAIRSLQDKTADPVFANHLQESMLRPECCGLDLPSFLLEPVQRLARYPLLLKHIQKFTPSPSEECNLLALCIEESQSLLDRVNRAMLDAEDQQRLVQIQRRLSIDRPSPTATLPLNLAGLTRTFGERKLLHAGLWIKLRSRRRLLVLLFSDFLLMTEACSGPTSLDTLADDTVRLKIYRRPLPLDDIWLLREAEPARTPAHLQGAHQFRALELEAHDSPPLHVHLPADQYDTWISAISTAKHRLKATPESPRKSSLCSLGSLRITLLSATSIKQYKHAPDTQFYCRLSTDGSEQSFQTTPVRGPNPQWNQTFSLPVHSFATSLSIELFKYDPYEVNESFGDFRLSLAFLEGFTEKCIDTLQLHPNQDTPLLNISVHFVSRQ